MITPKLNPLYPECNESISAYSVGKHRHHPEIEQVLGRVTGKRVEVPLLAVIKFRGDKLYHEHIYWDQASVLVQVGLLDPKGLPAAGIETARKVADNALPSNGLMTRWNTSAGKPI